MPAKIEKKIELIIEALRSNKKIKTLKKAKKAAKKIGYNIDDVKTKKEAILRLKKEINSTTKEELI